MTVQSLQQIADDLDKAAVSARPIEQITKSWAISLDDAYRVQDMVVERRLKRGETRRGFGLAFSSRAKMKQFGLSDQIYGCITSGMEIADGGLLHLEKLIQPRVEPEVSFILGKDVSEPLPVFELMRSVEAIAVTLDIIDSRFKDFKFALADVIADNSSHAGYVLGTWQNPAIDIENLGILLEINGREAAVGSTAALLGHPARCLRKMAELASERGTVLRAGSIVMAGAATSAIALEPGTAVRVRIRDLGTAGFEVA
jgi:2-oxo-3-hexenedioate decarboxylase